MSLGRKTQVSISMSAKVVLVWKWIIPMTIGFIIVIVSMNYCIWTYINKTHTPRKHHNCFFQNEGDILMTFRGTFTKEERKRIWKECKKTRHDFNKRN